MMYLGGSRFLLYKNDKATFSLKCGCSDQNTCYCNVPKWMFGVGDLKFYAQMLGQDNMSGSWCMWRQICQMAPRVNGSQVQCLPMVTWGHRISQGSM